MLEPIKNFFTVLGASEVLPAGFEKNDNTITLYFSNCLATSIFMNSLAQKIWSCQG
ncbi:MAG: hypothetical protein K0R73_297 [Candidatus Midichloriaceae bacterium]|jgi:hypothetical protein|nr:hypothetical protein [Candidatus Midichloriaceae bacterium]